MDDLYQPEANVEWLCVGMGSDSKVGKRFLLPGVGYGGSCFPKDVKDLARTACPHEFSFNLVETTMKVNDH